VAEGRADRWACRGSGKTPQAEVTVYKPPMSVNNTRMVTKTFTAGYQLQSSSKGSLNVLAGVSKTGT